MTELSGEVLETLWDDGELALCRGRRHGNPVLVMAPVAEEPAAASLGRLEHEYALAAELESAWAARPLALVRHRGRPALVLEAGGEPIDRAGGRPLELTRFLRIAVGLAAALGQVHRRGLVHKDIKPRNVLVDAAGAVRLTGFGMASRLPRERQAPGPPEVIAGSLAYMAPEQTGRMNRSIDSRSDLYSLGMTYYEMLTGALPFAASDPLGWVHCHIARQPAPPDQVAPVPPALSAIVMKLLAKTAEERYQTAAGVEADLRRCLTEWETRGRIERFAPGQHDTSARLMMPERLYGREREIDALLAAFDRVVAHGASELVLVSGYSGIGKSSVVNELHKALIPSRGRFASGKFDQYKRDIPYATLAQAFQGLVRRILGESEAALGRWRDALRAALGANGQLIVNLVPELEAIIGKQPAVPDLPSGEAQTRFQAVFQRFLGVFARPEHPLALFLDDLQWLDTPTLGLLAYLVTATEVRHLLLVGAYRSNEVGPSHPLVQLLEGLRRSEARVCEVVLGPLSGDDLGRLIADALHCERLRAEPLAQLVHAKTSGNPFFAIQFVGALADEGLLAFDADAAAWSFDLAKIRAKGFTDNVVDLMAGKLNRLPASTQETLGQLACLGGPADIAILALAQDKSAAAIHADLWEAVVAGLVFQTDGVTVFAHDRVQEAAYALLRGERRAEVHLRIGRLLIASMDADAIAERIFDVVNQFSRCIPLLSDRDEKERLAELHLAAGRKAKASTACASACLYLATGADLLGDHAWQRRYDLAFGLHLEWAECEYLTGQLPTAERLLAELLRQTASIVDRAAVFRLKILLHVMRAEYGQAVDSGLECLRLLGIVMPAHPTREKVQDEYLAMRRSLGERSVESLIDLPLMSDPEKQAAMRVLAALVTPAFFTDNNLFYVLVYHMVSISLQHGATDESANAYSWLGCALGPILHRYSEGYRFADLACSLVEKHGFTAAKAKTYLAMEMVALWTAPIETAIDFARQAFHAGVETGDLSYACYSCDHLVTDLPLQGVALDEVLRESEKAVQFVRKVGFRDGVDTVVCQRQFILDMQGRTRTFASFSDARFDEEVFEADLTEGRMTTMMCCYWILKLQARFLAGDYRAAGAAAERARALLWSLEFHIQAVNYCVYDALTIAALHETAGPEQRAAGIEALRRSLQRLAEWAESRPETFVDKHALVSAELARVEGRDLDAMRLYEEAIQAAREHGFVHDEGLANELAGKLHLARGHETSAYAHLRNARYCYSRWGAAAKVMQLDRHYPRLREERGRTSPAATIGALVEQIDVLAVVKASQAMSGEIVLGKLIETLMVIAVENAGAERALLILLHSDQTATDAEARGDTLQIEAEATFDRTTVEVRLQQEPVTAAALPESVLHTVIRTRQSVILDDASAHNPFSADAYLRGKHARSLLCLPLVKQARLIGVLYLENSLASHVFTPARISLLELLATQAAISLDNARLYDDLREREARIRRLVDANIIGITIWDFRGRIIDANEAFLDMVGYARDDLASGRLRWTELTPAEWRDVDERAVAELKAAATARPHEKEYVRKDGSRVPVMVGAATFGDRRDQGVAFVLDLTARKRAEDALRESEQGLREAHVELAHVTRVTMLGELSASIAHEVNQPLAAVVANAEAGRRWLGREPPEIAEVRDVLARITRDAHRAGEVIGRVRALANKADVRTAPLDINDVVTEVIPLVRRELLGNRVSLRTELAAVLPTVLADRVQLQQVIINLVINGIEAMHAVADRPRELVIRSRQDGADVLVTVEDCGVGISAANAHRLFDAFFTTKPGGLGMGLSICRSIIESHGGKLSADSNAGPGAVIRFTLPAHQAE